MSRDAKWYANWVRLLPASSADEKMRNLEAADMLEDLDKRVPCWISVEERLPEKHIGVIARCKDKHIDVMTYDGRHWNWNGKHEDSVTHWMPLPETPEEDA